MAGLVLPGDVISYSVAITNVAETSLEQVVLDNPLPAGVVYVAPRRQNRVWATPGEGGWLRSEDGRVDLRAPAGAVAGRTELRYVAQASQGLPPHILVAFDLDAVDEQGQPVTQFGRPVTLSAFFDPRQLSPGALDRLSLFHLNKESGEWDVVPSQIDPRWRRVVAQIDQLAAPAQVVAGATDSNGQQMASDDGSETYGLGQSADAWRKSSRPLLSAGSGAATAWRG